MLVVMVVVREWWKMYSAQSDEQYPKHSRSHVKDLKTTWSIIPFLHYVSIQMKRWTERTQWKTIFRGNKITFQRWLESPKGNRTDMSPEQQFNTFQYIHINVNCVHLQALMCYTVYKSFFSCTHVQRGESFNCIAPNTRN